MAHGELDPGMVDADLAFASAVELAAMIADRSVTASAVLESMLARVDRYNPALNAIVVDDRQRARQRAADADRAIAGGERWGPLHGVPITVKESFDVAGLPTTFGDPAFVGNVPSTSAAAVQRLHDAGAVLFGKTNVPLHLADWQSYNEVYGVTVNPWDAGRTPGGSSGGSAAALAAGLTALELGSDIGSSVRNPASYCGVCSHKPTYGIVSQRGHRLPGSEAPLDINVCGPLARTVADLRVALDVVAGPDPIKARGWALQLPRPALTTLAGVRVGIMVDAEPAPTSRGVQRNIEQVAEFLAEAGAVVRHGALPDIDLHRQNEMYILALRAATSGRLSDEAWAQWRELAEAGDPSDHSYVARMARGNSISHRDWIRLNDEREALRRAWDAYFDDIDVLVCPAAMSVAFAHDRDGERTQRTIPIDGQRRLVTDQIFWAGFSGLVGLPSTVVPIGFDDGLPVGAQLVGRAYHDYLCLDVAELIERGHHRFVRPPAFDTSTNNPTPPTPPPPPPPPARR